MSTMVLISGLPGAGKTSTARQVAASFSPSMHLEVDRLRAMMVRGYVAPDEVSDWNEALSRQCLMESQAASALATVYMKQGVVVILDDVALPPVFSRCYSRQPDLHKILLMPSVETLRQRLASRADIYDATFSARISQLHGYLASLDKPGWTVLDTSSWTLEETVREVIASIPLSQ